MRLKPIHPIRTVTPTPVTGARMLCLLGLRPASMPCLERLWGAQPGRDVVAWRFGKILFLLLAVQADRADCSKQYLSTAVPFWGQPTSNLNCLSPKRDCRFKRVIKKCINLTRYINSSSTLRKIHCQPFATDLLKHAWPMGQSQGKTADGPSGECDYQQREIGDARWG